ncbi:MAG: SAM-dependent chlorinase/fluorinase [Gammaproteobacteria bacterium]|nr:SAM-dependent chlorinase/fluorinase [Gammaproteobacteria bacterium]
MLVLFTDFGLSGPYVGQMKSVLHKFAPQIPVFDLMHDAPVFNPFASAHLLAAYRHSFADNAVFLSIVDPGVGSNRRAIVVRADQQYFVGPDNGLFYQLRFHSKDIEAWEVSYQPESLSTSFHGRDLFAPVAAMIASGDEVPGDKIASSSLLGFNQPRALAEVIYVDHYGNCITGLNADEMQTDDIVKVKDKQIAYARTFSASPEKGLFWYINSSNMVEIAQNQGSAAHNLDIGVGKRVFKLKLP